MNQKSATSNGSFWPRRWWERLFNVVLVLIALVGAVILFLVIWRPYCQDRTWQEWWAGEPGSCAQPLTPGDWPEEAMAYCKRQLAPFGSSPVSHPPLEPASPGVPTVHERYFWYRLPPLEETYFFLAVQDQGNGEVSSSSVKLDVMLVDLPHPYNQIPVFCSGPRPLPNTPAAAPGGPTIRTWGWFCRISGRQGGFAPPSLLRSYRVFIKSTSSESLPYCYVAVCERQYPSGQRCPDPENSQIQSPARGYQPSPSYSPPYPSSSSGSGGQ